jgi:O-antigen/teichoic acid export membrane protein
MDTASPARLYATLVGGALVIIGIIGFFYEASFAVGDDIQADEEFGFLSINGWENAIHIVAGLLGLALAGSNASARLYALGFGAIYVVLAIWGWIDETILELIPVNDEANVVHLVLGVTGIAAGLATPAEEPPRPARTATPGGGPAA